MGRTPPGFSFRPSDESLERFASATAEEKLRWLEEANEFIASARRVR